MFRRFAMVCGLVSCMSLTGCDVDVADDGAMPEVDVQPGNVPDVDVAGPTVGTETKTVEVPTIEPAPEGSADAEEEVVVPPAAE